MAKTMTLTEALQIFELTSLSGTDGLSLKRQYRKLAKLRHPDSGNDTVFTLTETTEAYEFLLDRLKTGNTELPPGIKLKNLKVLLFNQYCKTLAQDEFSWWEFFETYDVKLDLFISVIITRNRQGSNISTEKTEIVANATQRIKARATMANNYAISILAPIEIGDEIKITVLDGFTVRTTVNAPVFSAVVKTPIGDVGKREVQFNLTVRKNVENTIEMSIN